MTSRERQRLETIIAKVETLQNTTKDPVAKDRLGAAKSELLRLWSETGR